MANLSDRCAVVIVSMIALAALAAGAIPHRDVVLYNHSPSIPTGLYIRNAAEIRRGSIVTVRARDVAPLQAGARRFNDDGDRFIKRVAATGGARVCSDGRVLRIDGLLAVRVNAGAARAGILGWAGCRVLDADEVLLLGDSTDSFDGRYWGPVKLQLIEGTWRELLRE